MLEQAAVSTRGFWGISKGSDIAAAAHNRATSIRRSIAVEFGAEETKHYWRLGRADQLPFVQEPRSARIIAEATVVRC